MATTPVERWPIQQPSRLTIPIPYQSTVQYNFDTGAITREQDPKGAAVTRTYDSAGRLEQVTHQVNNAYRRFVYWPDGLQVLSYETLNEGVGAAYEAYSTGGRPVILAGDN